MATDPQTMAMLAALGSGQQSPLMDPTMAEAIPRMTMAQAMMQNSMSDAPTSKWGALGRLGQALAGNYVFDQATQGLQQGMAGQADQVAGALAQSYPNHPALPFLRSANPYLRMMGLQAATKGLTALGSVADSLKPNSVPAVGSIPQGGPVGGGYTPNALETTDLKNGADNPAARGTAASIIAATSAPGEAAKAGAIGWAGVGPQTALSGNKMAQEDAAKRNAPYDVPQGMTRVTPPQSAIPGATIQPAGTPPLTHDDLSYGVHQNESGGSMAPGVVGDGGAANGVMQMHGPAIKDVNDRFGTNFTPQMIRDNPVLGKAAGDSYLKLLEERFPGRPDLQLAAYNQGPTATANAGGVVPAAQDYVRRGLEAAIQHQRAQTQQPPSPMTTTPLPGGGTATTNPIPYAAEAQKGGWGELIKNDAQSAAKTQEDAEKGKSTFGTTATIRAMAPGVANGPGADYRLQLSRLASVIGLSPEETQKWVGENPVNGELMQKKLFELSTGAVRGMGAREPGSVLQMFQKNYPNMSSQGMTIDAMTRLLDMQQHYNQDYAAAKSQWVTDSVNNMNDKGYRGLGGFDADFGKTHDPRAYQAAALAASGMPDEVWRRGLTPDMQKQAMGLVMRAYPDFVPPGHTRGQ